MPPRLPASLRALLDAGGALIRQSSSGRVALARAADVVHEDALPRPMRRLPDVLDAAYAEAAQPIDAKRVKKALRGLDDVDPEPLAVRPGSQVHAAQLDGEPVVAKVRRPGLAATVRSDLALFDLLAAPLGSVFSALDVGAVLEELREGALDELDLEHEGGSQRQAGRVLRRVEGVRVPTVHSEATDEDVLVMERLDGPTLADGAEPPDPEGLARTLVEAHVTAWREGAMILTDPRPGHVVLLCGGEIGLLGTGVSRPGDRKRAQAVLDAARALADEDEDAFAEVVADRLALLDAATARAAFPLLRDLLGPLAEGPARLDGPALAGIGDRALERLPELVELAALVTPQPADVAAARMLGQLGALLSRLGATHDWLRMPG
jgi:predicted unusual protein kinase regulating ubiquinone biosynthesis (AarF/ABC1/UbiB family)